MPPKPPLEVHSVKLTTDSSDLRSPKDPSISDVTAVAPESAYTTMTMESADLRSCEDLSISDATEATPGSATLTTDS